MNRINNRKLNESVKRNTHKVLKEIFGPTETNSLKELFDEKGVDLDQAIKMINLVADLLIPMDCWLDDEDENENNNSYLTKFSKIGRILKQAASMLEKNL